MTNATLSGVQIPDFLYGTAWKEERTQPLVERALETGFRGIDTANQRRHYYEVAVGQAIAHTIERGLVSRTDLFLQTKFTFRGGQDQRLPYDATAPVAVQVAQSFASSLVHLGVEQIDSYLLHGPTHRVGLSADDWAAWQAMEAIYDSGRARFLGVSNFTAAQLVELCERARIQPTFVQNRCFADRGWDADVRAVCRERGIICQAFSLLTANQAALTSDTLLKIARRHSRTVPQIVFRFAIDMGMLPLTGTTSREHMQADLDVLNFRLENDECEQIEQAART